MSEDRILFRRNVGPFVSKDLLREKMSPEDAHKELDIIQGLLEEIVKHEKAIRRLEGAISTYETKYNLSGRNSLLSFLVNKSGVKIKKKKEKDKK